MTCSTNKAHFYNDGKYSRVSIINRAWKINKYLGPSRDEVSFAHIWKELFWKPTKTWYKITCLGLGKRDHIHIVGSQARKLKYI